MVISLVAGHHVYVSVSLIWVYVCPKLREEECCVCIIVSFSTVHCIVLFCTHAYVVVYDVIVHYIMCVRAP